MVLKLDTGWGGGGGWEGWGASKRERENGVGGHHECLGARYPYLVMVVSIPQSYPT